MTEIASGAVVGAWVGLARAHQGVLATIEAALKAAGLPPLAWYDVLLVLERTGEAGLRPYELERELLLPQYGLSRLVDRIAVAGLLERRPCEQDRRGHRLVLTRAGRRMRGKMWPVYGAAIETAVGARLGEGDAKALTRLLDRLRRSTPH